MRREEASFGVEKKKEPTKPESRPENRRGKHARTQTKIPLFLAKSICHPPRCQQRQTKENNHYHVLDRCCQDPDRSRERALLPRPRDITQGGNWDIEQKHTQTEASGHVLRCEKKNMEKVNQEEIPRRSNHQKKQSIETPVTGPVVTSCDT